MQLSSLLRRHRATISLVALLGSFLFSSQSSSCRFPAVQSDTFCCDCSSFIFCAPGSSSGSATNGPPVYFEANAGQADARFEFVARSAGLAIFLDSGQAWLDVRGAAQESLGVLHMSMTGGARHPEVVAEQPLSGRMNYLLGNDPSKWVRDVPTFGRIRYREVYPGIDLVYYGAAGRIEHDFIVGIGADPAKIRMRVKGSSAFHLNSDGDAVLSVSGRDVVWKKPSLYQSIAGLRRHVEGRYKLLDGASGELGFEVGVYDVNRPLIIDPVILYSTYVGRGGNETAARMAVDSNGNAYLTGISTDASFPVTPGLTQPPAQSAQRGNVVVTKMNGAGSELVYSTVIGGAGIDLGIGIAVDGTGAVHVTGSTDSEDFPTTVGAFQRAYGKPIASDTARTPVLGDCFLTKLNSAGNAVVYSTYLGGTGLDACSAVAIDGDGNAFVTGGTSSANFPSTEGSFQRVFRGGRGSALLKDGDGFIAKFNRTGAALIYATFFGGNGEEAGTAIAVDGEGNAYVTGSTNSTFGFPLSNAAPQTRYAGAGGNPDYGLGDAFILKLNPAGTALVYGTLLGGSRDEIALGIAVDDKGAAYVTGSSLSPDLPTTPIARQANYRGQSTSSTWFAGDAIVAKINPAGNAWDYVTYLGGSSDDRGSAIVVDAEGSAWIAGHTRSGDFPLTIDATQQRWAGERPEFYQTGDVFLARLNPTGQTLLFSTYLGGAGNEWALGMARDSKGSIYLAGGTSSPDLVTTPSAYQRTYGTASSQFLPLGDVFLTKFGDSPDGGAVVRVADVKSAASFEAGGVSPGQIVVISGTEMGPGTGLSSAPAAGVFPTAIGETRVLVDGKTAPMLYSSARQVNAIIPYDVAGKQRVDLIVEYRGVRSAPVNLTVQPSLPGLFSANASGRGQAAAQNQDGSFNTPANPADRNSILVLYGTGEGQTVPAGVDGKLATEPYPRPELPVNVTIGNQLAPIVYAGSVPGLVAGLIQINVRVPEGVASGEQPVFLRVGDRQSQSGLTVSIR